MLLRLDKQGHMQYEQPATVKRIQYEPPAIVKRQKVVGLLVDTVSDMTQIDPPS